MIVCIAAILLHLGPPAPVIPRVVLEPTIEIAALLDTPVAKVEVQSAEGQPVLGASQVAIQSTASDSDTQTPQTLPTNQTPGPQPATPIHLFPDNSAPARLPWLALSVAQHGAAAFDAYSTRLAITHGAIEQDPVMRPFAHSAEIYAAIQVSPVMLDILARHMQRSRNNLWRRTWWVPQSASIGVFLFSGIHNLKFAKKQ